MIKLITTASDISKTQTLQESLNKNSWDYEILIHNWEGFGGKILETYRYLKNNQDIKYFFYTDSYDTIVTSTMNEALTRIKNNDKILLSAERACYPHPEKAERYPYNESPWHFVNGGGWFCNSDLFCKSVEANGLQVHDVDQVWFTDLFLNNPSYVELDYNCDLFQTIAFCPESDFDIKEGRIRNTVTNTYPIFIHGNGHTPLDRFL